MITYTASNCIEPSAEAVSSGPGLRINAGDRTQTIDTLFTEIMQQVKADGVSLVVSVNEAQAALITDDTKTTGEEASVDVCSILAQMMMMNTAVVTDGTKNPDEKTANGILSVISGIPGTADDSNLNGLDHASSVILQNDGRAAEVLRALADARGAADAGGQPTGYASAAQIDTALAGITEALKNELTQSAAAADAQPARAAENPAISSFVSENLSAVSDKNGANATSQREEMMSGASVNLTDKQAAVRFAADSSRAGSDNAGANSDENSFSGLISRDEKSSNEAGTAESGANQVQRGTAVQGETMAEKTSAIERALNKFTDDLRSLRSGNQEIKIILEPESLGVLIISVIKNESGISAKIKSEDKEIVALISEHLQKLVSSMQSKGIKVNDLDVVYSQTEQNTSFTQNSFSQERDQTSRGYKPPLDKSPDADVLNNEIWQSYYSDEKSGDTTVDYRV